MSKRFSKKKIKKTVRDGLCLDTVVSKSKPSKLLKYSDSTLTASLERNY